MADDDTDVAKQLEDKLKEERAKWEKERDDAEAGLRRNKDAILEEKKALQRKLDAFEGIDPEEFAALKKEAEERATKKAKDEGNWEALKGQMEEAHGKELKKKEDRIAVLTAALEDHLCDKEVVQELAKHTKETELLLPHARKQIKMVEKDGRFFSEVRNPDGTPAFMATEGGHMIPETIEHYVVRLKEKFPAAFPASGDGGSGARESKAGRSGDGKIHIRGDDQKAFADNLEKIASGEVVVDMIEG